LMHVDSRAPQLVTQIDRNERSGFFAISDAHILFAAASHGNRERRRAAKQYERWGQCDDKGQGTRAGIE
ncbi:MAG: hypothetical protein WAK39_20280, partial [Pseudolabrys sp.]